MGKLNIAHHKSYHPYRRDNIERVKRDEEEAEIKRAKEEGRMSLADSESRLTLLRERAGVTKSKRREDEKRERELLAQATDPTARKEALAPTSSSLNSLDSGKHINLFKDIEQSMVSSVLAASEKLRKAKAKESEELEKGIPLAPSAKDLKPWYSEKQKVDDGPIDDSRRHRDLTHKARSDPLTAIQKELGSRDSPLSSRDVADRSRGRTWGEPPSHPSRASYTATQIGDDLHAKRVARESSERARAQALRERRMREAAGSATPSTVHGGEDAFKYGDQFHSGEVAEAHRRRDYLDPRERTWEGERRRGSAYRRWDAGNHR